MSALPNVSSSATARTRGQLAALFVWFVWAILLFLALGFVLHCGSNVPYWDDWDMVPYTTGDLPVTPGWLWAQHNEHRIALPKLLFLGLYRAGNNDLRFCMLYSVLALGVVAAALILAMRLRRGYTIALDALFPLVLLHLGQPQNLLWAFQLGFITGTLLVGLLLAMMVLGPAGGSVRLIGIALLTLLLPFCGANALAFVPGLALWLGWVGVTALTEGRRWEGWPIAVAALALLLVGLYLIGLESGGDPRAGRPGGVVPVLRVAGQFLSMAGGAAVAGWWFPAAVLVVVLSAVTTVSLAAAARRPANRSEALGLLALLSGFVVLALGIGWGRGGFGEEAGLANRYVSLAAPLVCLLYCAWELYLPRTRARIAQTCLFGVFALLLIPNTLEGLRQGQARRLVMLAVTQDARAGMTPEALARRYEPALCDRATAFKAIAGLEMLRSARLEPYAEDAPE